MPPRTGLPCKLSKRPGDKLGVKLVMAPVRIPEVRTALEKFGVLQTELPAAAYADALRKERDAYARVIEKAGIKLT
jgi:hypothetical protein